MSEGTEINRIERNQCRKIESICVPHYFQMSLRIFPTVLIASPFFHWLRLMMKQFNISENENIFQK